MPRGVGRDILSGLVEGFGANYAERKKLRQEQELASSKSAADMKNNVLLTLLKAKAEQQGKLTLEQEIEKATKIAEAEASAKAKYPSGGDALDNVLADIIKTKMGKGAQPTADGVAPSGDLSGILQAIGLPEGSSMDVGPFNIKESADVLKRRTEAKELAGETENLMIMFEEARNELQSIPNFGEEGFMGRLAGVGAKAMGALGQLPDTQSFIDRVESFATTTSKAAGEVRPTDEDIRRFSKAMLNIGRNDRENANQLAGVLRSLKNRGASTSWALPFLERFEEITGESVNFDVEGQGSTKDEKGAAASNIDALLDAALAGDAEAEAQLIEQGIL